jgi:large repetitive protein
MGSSRRAALALLVLGVVAAGALLRGPGIVPVASAGEAGAQWWPMSAPMSQPMSAPVGVPHVLPSPRPSLAPQSIAFTLPPNGPKGSTVTLAGSATSGLPLAYHSVTLTKCAVDGVTLTLLEMGVCTVEATQVGNGDIWAPAPPVPASMEVTPPEP